MIGPSRHSRQKRSVELLPPFCCPSPGSGSVLAASSCVHVARLPRSLLHLLDLSASLVALPQACPRSSQRSVCAPHAAPQLASPIGRACEPGSNAHLCVCPLRTRASLLAAHQGRARPQFAACEGLRRSPAGSVRLFDLAMRARESCVAKCVTANKADSTAVDHCPSESEDGKRRPDEGQYEVPGRRRRWQKLPLQFPANEVEHVGDDTLDLRESTPGVPVLLWLGRLGDSLVEAVRPHAVAVRVARRDGGAHPL